MIGSGLSGIAALKASLERDADENVVLYERSDNVGGIWNYTGVTILIKYIIIYYIPILKHFVVCLGHVLSPILFSLYMPTLSMLINYFYNIVYKIYAGDIVLYKHICTITGQTLLTQFTTG